MKDSLFNWEDLVAGKPLKKVMQAFTRAGAPVVSTDADSKARRSSGVSYKVLSLTFADNQHVELQIKQSGDIYAIKVNGSVMPIKNQENSAKAVAEIVKHLDAGRAKYQAKLARVKVELPKGTKATAPRIEVALQQHIVELDTQIADARKQAEALREELGEAALDSVALDAVKGDPLEVVIRENGKVIARRTGKEFLKMMVDAGAVRSGAFLQDAIKKYNEKNGPKTVAAEEWTQEAKKQIGKRKALDSVNLDEARELACTIIGGAILDSAGMDHALATLQIALDAAENNAPIYEAEGNADQAELCRNSAHSFREAITMLDSAEEGEEGEEEALEPNPDQESLFDAVPASVGNKLAEIGKTYWATIPLDKIFAAVQSAGYEPVDEDGEPWEGMLTGREGRAVIDLQKSGKPVKEALALQWYKMESGKFEVNAYVS